MASVWGRPRWVIVQLDAVSAAFQRRPELFWVAVVLGVLARGIVASRGHNYDVESYRIVADIVAAGSNVYQGTHRYNYGPVWFLLLGALDVLPDGGASPLLALRWKVAGLLTLVDVAIGLALRSRFGSLAAILFFLNPVSIIITGHNSQFDNLAVLFGLLGALALDRWRSTDWSWLGGLLLVGVSLATKHILFVFPLWIALRQTSWRRKLLAVLLPYGVFMLGFMPYAKDGWSGIVENVLLYRSIPNAPLWLGSMPAVLVRLLPLTAWFVGAMLILGVAWRRRPLLEAFLLYLVALVVFASAIANQYLAIPMAAIAVWPSWPFAAYTLAATAYLASGDATFDAWLQPWFGAGGAVSGIGYQRVLPLLGLGLVWQILSAERRKTCLRSLRWCGQGLVRAWREQVSARW